jgi:hypothetical protein
VFRTILLNINTHISLLARPWSYENFKTYPMMQLPPKKETRIERQVVNGIEKDVQVQVEIMPHTKPLFLFCEKDVSPHADDPLTRLYNFNA